RQSSLPKPHLGPGQSGDVVGGEDTHGSRIFGLTPWKRVETRAYDNVLVDASRRGLRQSILGKSAPERKQRTEQHRIPAAMIVKCSEDCTFGCLRDQTDRDRVFEDTRIVKELMGGAS